MDGLADTNPFTLGLGFGCVAIPVFVVGARTAGHARKSSRAARVVLPILVLLGAATFVAWLVDLLLVIANPI
ncbi:hypothetical protein AB0I55_11625 [Actinocatenispora sera]|uniref:hypothetical protein n=1 Tax=Actinocatenispora sera TaxID=390989 RepID=UPI0033F098B9